MKRLLPVITALVLLTTLIPPITPAAAQASSEPYAGKPLCLPDEYNQPGSDCLLAGPSARLAELASLGLTYPPAPLPGHSPDPKLNDVTVRFARIAIEPPDQARFFNSIEEATQGGTPSRVLPPGKLIYISYTQAQQVEGGHYLQVASGEWVRASPAAYPRYQGLVFDQNPRNSVGWITENTVSRSAPGVESPETGIAYTREQAVSIYGTAKANKTTWYMVGIDEWIERRYIREFKPNLTPPEGVDNKRWIEVNLYEQTLAVYEDGQVRFATMIASGAAPFYTRPGLFKIQKKKPLETMSGAFEADRSDYYYLENVPWTMYFDEERALHGAYWRAMFGFPQSHGCVNLSIGDAHWIFDWANEGDWVYVWDPSGETPTDPSQYTKGGA